MNNPRIEKLAELLVNYSVKIRDGDRVAIIGHHITLPLLKAIYARTLQAGGHPIIQLRENGIDELLYRHGSKEQIEYVHEPYRIITEKYDVRLSIVGDENTRALSNVSPVKMVWYDQARADLMETMMKRSAVGEFRWVVAPYPTQALAQDAEMSLTDYSDFVFNACMPDPDKPVDYWMNLSNKQQRIIDWLNGKHRVHILGTETDLWLSITGRKFINCDGRFNMPDGEIFTGPLENSAQGRVYFSYPAIEGGREVTGIRLSFNEGKVVNATAEKNEKFLHETLDTDAGAKYIGEFAIGTNNAISRFTRQILFDEKIGGSFHLALGAGYPESGSQNKSAIHWDMICDLRTGGEIWVDSQLLFRNGEFLV